MVDYARGAGVAEEDHLGSWSISAKLLERWGGLVQTVGAPQPGVHGESKGNTPPPSTTPSLSPCISNHPPCQRVCVLPRSVKPTRFVVWLLFLPTGPWGDFFCRSRQPGLLSAKTALYGCAYVSQRVKTEKPLFIQRIDRFHTRPHHSNMKRKLICLSGAVCSTSALWSYWWRPQFNMFQSRFK